MISGKNLFDQLLKTKEKACTILFWSIFWIFHTLEMTLNVGSMKQRALDVDLRAGQQ